MVDYRRHLACIIFNECQLRTIDFDEEICFRFGINIQRTGECHGIRRQFPSSPAYLMTSNFSESMSIQTLPLP